MKKIRNTLWGIVLIVLGVIIGGNALGITNVNIFFNGWWTLFIIIPCFIGLFKEREKTGSIIGLIIGIVLLLCCQDILNFDTIWKLALPTILIIIGISFIFKDVFNSKLNEEIKNINEKNIQKEEYCATFSGQNVKFDGEKFNGTTLTAVFGGVKCDLKNAIIENDVVINVSSIFGGTEIYIPDNVKVKIRSTSIFGGVDEKKVNSIEGKEVHTIYINATCIFGGVEIK